MPLVSIGSISQSVLPSHAPIEENEGNPLGYWSIPRGIFVCICENRIAVVSSKASSKWK